MDYSSWVDTTLDLNSNPLRVNNDDVIKRERFCLEKEVKNSFMELGKKLSVKEEVSL